MIDQIIGERYRVLEELGRGGMGTVFLAQDPILEREVAIKLLTTTFQSSHSSREIRFHREAKIVARMDHPSIVGIFDIGDHEGAPFLVMPFVPGSHLRRAYRESDLTLEDVLEVGIRVADALEHSHRHDVVHRDIKPENIIVERREEGGLRVRVTDFGLATVATSDRLTKSGSVIGTASYLSPEQARGREVDGRSDIYSLAVVLYEAITGHVPFSGAPHAVLYRIVHEAPTPPSEWIPDLDHELETLLLRNLSKSSKDRHQRALDFAQALTRYRESLGESELGYRLEHAAGTAGGRRREKERIPLVGRSKEISELEICLESALVDGCQFVVVGGDTGIGKSRLLEELEDLASGRQIRTLHGRLVEQDLHFPYQGFCEAIQEYFFVRSRSGEITADFSDLAPELVQLFPVLAEIEVIRSSTQELSLRPPPPSAIEDPTYLYEVLARAFTRIAAEGPLVLLFEGLHAAEISLEALQYLIRRLGPSPVLVVATYRSTQIAALHPLTGLLDAFDGDRRFTELHLEAMDRREVAELLGHASAGKSFDEPLLDQLYESAEGNPYFTLELFRSLEDSEAVVLDESGTYVLLEDRGIAAPSLPATIQQAVEKRVEGLPEESHRVLARASVLGRAFQYRELEAIADSPEDLEGSVESLIDRGFLKEIRQVRGDALRFSSAVVRDVLYASLPRRRRRRLHRRIGDHLEERFGIHPERVLDQLVHHYSQADVPDRVIRYGLALVRQKLELSSADEAVRIARLVLEFLDDSEDLDQSAEGQVRRDLAAALRFRGDLEGALTELSRSIRCFGKMELDSERIETIAIAAETAWDARRVGDAQKLVEKGLNEESCGREPRLRLLSLGITLANLRGDHELASSYGKERSSLAPVSESRTSPRSPAGRIVVGIPAAVRARHPAALTTNEEEEVLSNLFETLLTTDPEGAIIPQLCRRWEVLEGGSLLRLELREDVLFHDGTPLCAENVRASFECAARDIEDHVPAALSSIQGFGEFRSGRAPHIQGIHLLDDHRLEIEITECLPGYSALLTDPWLAISKSCTQHIGTGPFRWIADQGDRISLEPFEKYWGPSKPRLQRLEFRVGITASQLSAGLRSADLDVGRDLPSRELDDLLRLRHRRWQLLEATRKSTCFAIFNQRSPSGASKELRHAVLGVVRTRDLVRSTLGRLAVPAEGLIPPGILGHDPGRRRRPLPWDDALLLVDKARQEGLIPRLRIAVHPILQERYHAITRALLQLWSDLGLDIVLETGALENYLELSSERLGEVDLILGRWSADYSDPDNFTRTLFHTEVGRFRHQCSTLELDERMDEARRESRAGHRRRIYREIETDLIDSFHVLPLFHEIDQRVAQPEVLDLKLSNSPPWVNYSELARKDEKTPSIRPPRGGSLRIAFPETVADLDPHIFERARWQITPLIFESLTRQGRDARIALGLAGRMENEDGGLRYRFEIRDDARFHDGRRVNSRDVRFSFERLLRAQRSTGRWILSMLRGAHEFVDGETDELEGFLIVTSREFTIELDHPVAFFPALLSSAPIIPEECETFNTTWRAGCIGTGPFRVRRFEPGRRVDLERNPHYRNPKLPRSEALQIHLGIDSQAIHEGFKDGTYSLATSLLTSDFDQLRRHETLSASYQEVPGLSTCFLAMNAHRGPLADIGLRRRVYEAISLDNLVNHAVGRYGRVAKGLIPPDLLPHETESRSSISEQVSQPSDTATLRILPLSVFDSTYSEVLDYLVRILSQSGFQVEVLDLRHDQAEALAATRVDLVLSRWTADYPDPDSFVHGLLHSKEGDVGSLCGLPEIDHLIRMGREEIDAVERQDIYREIEKILQVQALVLPLFHEQSYRFVRPEVQGFELLLTDPQVAYDRLWIKS